jgi:hypothetical protein
MLHTTAVPLRFFVALLLGALLCGPATAATPQQVNESLERAKEFLYKMQKPDGTWEQGPPPKDIVNTPGEAEITGPQYGGLTAVATYALLASGEKHQDQRLGRAIDFLKKTKMAGTYAAGFRAMVWLYLPPTAEIRQLAKIDAEILLGTANKEARHTYSLLRAKAKAHGDSSNSQIGLLGLWAAGELGVEVPAGYWTAADQMWRGSQLADGAWFYGHNFPQPHPGMTAAGIASLFLINERKQQSGECRGNPQEEAIDKARAWLAANFDKVTVSPVVGEPAIYNLYALERCGVAGGYRNFGKHDWYQFVADFLLKSQQPDGRWRHGHPGVDLGGVPPTAFGMLVMTYGRAPLVMSKLEYFLPDGSTPVRLQPARPLPPANPQPARPLPAARPAPGKPPVVPPAVQMPRRPAANWNQRPRDAANVTKWIGKGLERLLQWQIVNLDAPLPELLDAPILYIAGNQPLHFNQQELEKLRQYCEHGGLILGNADCGARIFAESFRQLGMTLFDKKYEFRELPADHPIYTRQQFNRTRWKVPPKVQALSNEVRELMVLLPDADASRYWQMQVVKDNDAMHELAADLFLYLYGADKKDIRYKGETHLVARPTSQPTRTVEVARLRYGGNWDPEPVAWSQLSNLMLGQDRTEVVTGTVELGKGQLTRKYNLAHLTGTAAFTLSEAARKELRQYVEGGGTLLMEAAGGRTEFAVAMERELNEIFGEAARKAAVLPQDHELYKVAEPLERFSYRSFARKVLGAMSGPRLRGFQINGRTAVLLSSEDLSAGLMGSPVDGIAGYDPATARAVGRRVVLYATKAPAAAPAAAPTTASAP